MTTTPNVALITGITGQDGAYLPDPQLQPDPHDPSQPGCLPQPQPMGQPGGAELTALQRLAAGAPNIHFTGRQDEATLRDLVGRARATIYVPMEEDFGMSPVEAMAAGKPVIGVAAGGLLETILPRQTGLLIPEPLTPEAFCLAVEELEALNPPSLRRACEHRAADFAEAIFVRRMADVLAEMLGEGAEVLGP